MFGGYGLYHQGVMFALIVNNELYFKADVEAAGYFQTFGSEPFTYEGKGKLVKLSYWTVVPDVLEDSTELKKWMDMACAAAVKAKQKAKAKSAKQPKTKPPKAKSAKSR
ncbi:TfoX/Sxy family protein [bacterium]|nr:MAG: TfoX/Sxy family protein [bacterium]